MSLRTLLGRVFLPVLLAVIAAAALACGDAYPTTEAPASQPTGPAPTTAPAVLATQVAPIPVAAAPGVDPAPATAIRDAVAALYAAYNKHDADGYLNAYTADCQAHVTREKLRQAFADAQAQFPDAVLLVDGVNVKAMQGSQATVEIQIRSADAVSPKPVTNTYVLEATGWRRSDCQRLPGYHSG